MVRKEQIFVCFSAMPSHERLDVLCTLASLCLPFELRFLNTCVDFLSRINTASAKDTEILASIEKNCHQLADVDIHDDSSRKKLIWALTLLHAGNRIVAHTIYRILFNTCSDLKEFGLREISPELSQELHLIFTLVRHHPSFTYEEKVKLEEIYLCMQSRLPGMRPVSPVPSPQPSPTLQQQLQYQQQYQQQQQQQQSYNQQQSQSSSPENSERSLSNGSSGRSKSQQQNDRSTIRQRNVKANGKTGGNGFVNGSTGTGTLMESVTAQLKELMGKDTNGRLPKAWKQFESMSATELALYSDQDLFNYDLSPLFVGQLRKVLNNLHYNHHHYHHHGKVGGNNGGGLLMPCTEEREKIVASKPINPKAITINPMPAPRSSLVKTCMGPPNVQPAFNHTQRNTTANSAASTTSTASTPASAQPLSSPAEQQPELPSSRASSSSSSGSSSLDPSSPPSSPTDSSIQHSTTQTRTAVVDSQRKPFPHPQQPPVLNSGTRPPSRAPSSTTAITPAPTSTVLRGASNNTGFLRPMSANNGIGPTGIGNNTHRPQQQSSSSASTVNRAASQPRDMCNFPVSLSYAAVPGQQQQQQVVVAAPVAAAQPASFIVDSSTPPPLLEGQPLQQQSQSVPPVTAAAQTPLSVYFNHGFHMPMPNGDGAYPQPPYTYITAPPPNSSRGPPGPHDMIYSPTSYLVQGQIVTQPLTSHHGPNSNGRMMDLSGWNLPPGSFIVTARSDPNSLTDYSRPPPPGSSSSGGGPSPIPGGGNVSCFNCGQSGHRGPQCQQTFFEEIIKPSPA